MDPPSLSSRRVRREFPDLTSPLTKSASRPTFIRNSQEARSARASAASYLRETRSKTHDFKGKLPRDIVRLRVLAYYQKLKARRITTHHSHALWRHARAKSLGLLSPPHSSTTIARAKVTIISDAPSQSHSIRRAFGFAVAWYFPTSGPAVAVLCCRAERARNRPRAVFRSS